MLVHPSFGRVAATADLGSLVVQRCERGIQALAGERLSRLLPNRTVIERRSWCFHHIIHVSNTLLSYQQKKEVYQSHSYKKPQNKYDWIEVSRVDTNGVELEVSIGERGGILVDVV